MRITINNYDNISMANVANAIFDMDANLIETFKNYSATYSSKKIQVFYRKTINGYAIDLHKIKK